MKIRREGDPSLFLTMKRLSVDWVYSQTCLILRAARLASGVTNGRRVFPSRFA